MLMLRALQGVLSAQSIFWLFLLYVERFLDLIYQGLVKRLEKLHDLLSEIIVVVIAYCSIEKVPGTPKRLFRWVRPVDRCRLRTSFEMREVATRGNREPTPH